MRTESLYSIQKKSSLSNVKNMFDVGNSLLSYNRFWAICSLDVVGQLRDKSVSYFNMTGPGKVLSMSVLVKEKA
jgi:hypothetical protein